MSIILVSEEIEQFRVDLAGCPPALAALDEIEDCDGDLEDAAINLAIQAGMEPDTSDRWLEGLAKRYRYILCQATFKEALEDGLNAEWLPALATETTLPLKLATPVAIYVIKTGVAAFCQSFEAKLQ